MAGLRDPVLIVRVRGWGLMAELTSKKRKNLPDKTFAIPEDRAYPITDRRHAANALARVAQYGTPSEKARVKAAVKKKFPDMGGD